MANNRIPISEPNLSGNEKKYVLDCLESSWISSSGKYIGLFEKAFAEYIGVKHAIAVSNGTVALHLALLALGLGPGDEVIVPTLTYIATANAVTYVGAKPVFVDCEPDTWCMSVDDFKAKVTPRTKAVIPVHLYGHPCDMDPLLELARSHGIAVVEDAAEALGSKYKGKMVGSFGDISTFSFYGNKTITTGEGGMVVCDDDRLAESVRLYKGQGMSSEKRYWFEKVGYNYRMTNIQAAIGLAQLEKIDHYIQLKRRNATVYNDLLGEVSGLILPVEKECALNTYWMYSVLLDGASEASRDQVMQALDKQRIETRPFFYPMHVMPPYSAAQASKDYPIATNVAKSGINLPSSTSLKIEQLETVAGALRESVRTAEYTSTK